MLEAQIYIKSILKHLKIEKIEGGRVLSPSWGSLAPPYEGGG